MNEIEFPKDRLEFPEDALTEYAIELPNASYETMQKVVSYWDIKGISESYMAIQTNDGPIQIAPYYKAHNVFQRMWQQLSVLMRFIFGGYKLTPERVEQLREVYKDFPLGRTAKKVEGCAQCAFCNQKVIDSQLVLDGERVQVLYNYAPIGMGGERLHFLVVAKRHCPRFDQLTKEEYEEAEKLTHFVQKRIQEHFEETPIRNTYVYHKTGQDSGQSVPHWHVHIVMTQNGAQEWWARLTVLRNILFGSFKLSPEELEKQRQKYYTILNSPR